MIVQIQRFRSKLAVRIILMICLIISPIILLMLAISSLMIGNLQDKLLESYRNELALGMTRVDAQISIIDQNINNLLIDNWTQLNLGGRSKTFEIEQFEFWQKLANDRMNLDMVQASYIKTNWNNGIAVTYDQKACTLDEIEQIKKYITGHNLTATTKSGYQLIHIGNIGYLLRNIGSFSYSFGFILKTDTVLSILQNVKNKDKDQFYIATKTGEIDKPNGKLQIDPSRRRQKIRLNGKLEDMMVLTYPSGKMNYMLVRLIPVKVLYSQIPFLEKLLQFIAFFGIIIIPIMYYTIRRLVLKPLFRLDKAMRQIENDNLDYRVERQEHSEEFQHMGKAFNRMADRIHDLTIDSYENDIERLQIEASNLKLQVNPHMLLNSLNMIYSLSQSKNYECIQEFTLSLVEYFRYSLHLDNKLVKLEDELKYVGSYLRIQRIRFPNAFTYVYDVDEDLNEERVPPLLIQSFVENAIKYALRFDREIEIILIVKKKENKLNITICDTGNGIDEETLELLERNEPYENKTGRHIGIWNCRKRLKMYYGTEASLSFSSVKNEGTQVRVQIPISDKEAK